MNNLKLILLLQVYALGALTLNAQDCPCEGGTAEYSVDCDGDGTNDACDAADCPPCSSQNPDPESPFNACCGSSQYIDTSSACCPNGDEVVFGVTNGTVSEWCDDCTYVKTYNEPNHCCDSEAGTFSYKTTYACQCHSCIQSDCTGISWADYVVALGTGGGNPAGTSLSLMIQNGELVAMAALCGLAVCPDLQCPEL